MKNETARREIESLDYYLQNHTDDYSEESHTAMMMAVKALGQEPCEDAVSRQYLIDIATKDGAYDYVSAQEIANAPSVNPQPKTGHWIKTSSGFKCSKCLIVHPHTSIFCPSCGAKMIEPQERSDKA